MTDMTEIRTTEHGGQMSRTAIVTGASDGIGAALAKQLAADGFRTVVNYSSSAAAAEEVVAFIKAAGGCAKAISADIADAAAMKILFDQAEAEFGRVDVLVNNASVIKNSLLAEVTDEDYQRQIAVNLTGSFNGMREGASRLRDGGRIINLSTSIIGAYMPGYSVYVATKAAVEAMTHVLAKELNARGITVNAVTPGPVETELLMTGRDLLKRITSNIPLGHLGQPEATARVISFLASPGGSLINGQIIKASNGAN